MKTYIKNLVYILLFFIHKIHYIIKIQTNNNEGDAPLDIRHLKKLRLYGSHKL